MKKYYRDASGNLQECYEVGLDVETDVETEESELDGDETGTDELDFLDGDEDEGMFISDDDDTFLGI